MHGDTRVDPYYWLNQRENDDVVAYLEAENAYTEALLSHTKGFQEKLYQEITARLQMSKKTFKKAIGALYKQRLIRIEEDGIYLV